MRKGLSVRIKRAQWKIAVTLDAVPEEFRDALKVELAATKTFLHKLDTLTAVRIHREYWLRRLARAETQIGHLNSGSRHRRGLFDFVGDVARSLFGTATEGELDNIRDAIQENRDSINDLIHLHNDQLTIFNATRTEIHKNRNAINEVINATKSLQRWFVQTTNKLRTDVNSLQVYNLINEKVTLVFEHLNYLMSFSSKQSQQRMALETGRLHEQLLPRTVLEEVAGLQDGSAVQLITPLDWYYTHIAIQPIYDTNYIAYIVILPLVDSSRYDGLNVQTYPVPLPNSTKMVQIVAEELIAVTVHSSEVLTPNQCAGDNPVVCNPPIKRNSGDSCTHQIAIEGDSVLHACSVAVRHYPGGYISMVKPNELVLATWGTHITQKCPGGDVTQRTVTGGTFRVQWDGHCTITNPDWSVAGLVTTSYQKNVDQWQPVHIDINITALLIPKLDHPDIKIPSSLASLSVVNLQKLKELAPLDNVNFTHHSSITQHVFITLSVLTLAVIVILIIIYVAKKKCQPQPALPKEESEPGFRLKIRHSNTYDSP